MIQGVISNLKPLIRLIIGWRFGVQEIVALLDTGFTGELKLPSEKVKELGLDITHVEPILLADDKVVNMRASIAFVSMEGVRSTVNVLISDGVPLIGGGLLKRYGYTLTADYKYDTLTLQR